MKLLTPQSVLTDMWDPNVIRTLVRYNKRTGVLTWKSRERSWFKSDRQYKIWNKRYAGKRVGYQDGVGRWRGTILGREFLLARVAWFLVKGKWPRLEIDHKNRKCWDDRWLNLREFSRIEQCRNQSLRANNSSGATGVMRLGPRRWKARIKVDYKYISLGTYRTRRAAIYARANAERKYGFSKGHGLRLSKS